MIRRFSRQTERALRAAGWHPGRNVQPRQPELPGYARNPMADAFNLEFEGLRLSLRGQLPLLGRLLTGGYLILGSGVAPDIDDVRHFESALGPFFPIGHKDDAEELVMTADGKVYSISAEVLCEDGIHSPVFAIGASGDDALEAIIRRRDAAKIGDVRRLT